MGIFGKRNEIEDLEAYERQTASVDRSAKQVAECVAKPEAGIDVPARKAAPEGENEQEAFKYRFNTHNVEQAKATTGKTLAAVRKQMGRHADNLTQSAAGNCPDADLEY
jgi:hypothetical protein